MMTKREVERLKQDFEKGMYVKKSTTIMCIAFALCVGIFLGNLLTVLYTDKPAAPRVATTGQTQTPQSQISQSTAARILNIERMTRNEPDNAGTWQQLGNAYYDANKPEAAIAAYEKSLELDAEHPNVWTDLGTMYRRTGQFEKAIESYNKALQYNPTHQNALFNKGIVYLHDLNQKEKGIAVWEVLLKANPTAKTPQGKPLKEFIDAHR